MNILKSLVGVIALFLGSGAAWTTSVSAAPPAAGDQVLLAANDEAGRDNDIHALDLTPAEAAKAKADAAAAKKARKESTRSQRAAAAESRKSGAALDKYPDNDAHSFDVNAAQTSKLKSEAATAKAERAARTPADKRAIREQKQKDLDVSEKSGAGS